MTNAINFMDKYFTGKDIFVTGKGSKNIFTGKGSKNIFTGKPVNWIRNLQP